MKDDVFAVIADSTRRHILQALAVERLAVGELVEELGVSQPTVSKHLKVLRTAGLVETEAVGQKRFYSLTPAPLTAVADWAQELLATPPTQAEQVEAGDESSADEQSRPQGQGGESAPVLEVPHPKTAGITFTPLTPFTPVLENRLEESEEEDGPVIEAEQEAVSEQVRQLAQNLSLGQEDEGPVSFQASTPQQVLDQETATLAEATQEGQVSQEAQDGQGQDEQAAQTPEIGTIEVAGDCEDSLVAARQAVADAEARAKVSDEQAYRQADEDASDERGLLAKLTRWGRRSSR